MAGMSDFWRFLLFYNLYHIMEFYDFSHEYIIL